MTDAQQLANSTSAARTCAASGRLLAITGALLILCFLAILMLSPAFYYGGDQTARPTPQFVVSLMAAGAVYLLAVAAVLRMGPAPRAVPCVVLAGLVLRALMFPATPILEDDFYRYLWEGGLVAHGHNPFALAPDDIAADDALRDLSEDAGVVAERVNHSHLASAYPPTAQAFFALAHWVAPWRLWAWRAVLLAADGAVLLLLFALLRRIPIISLSPFNSAILIPSPIAEFFILCYTEIKISSPMRLFPRKRQRQRCAL